jgi:hypothetical protein
MSGSIGGAVQEDMELGPRVRRANQLLAETIGPSINTVTVTWDITQDPFVRKLARLVLSDFTQSQVHTDFSANELTNEERLRAKFYRIWGDLLQARSHQQLVHLSGKLDVAAGQ